MVSCAGRRACNAVVCLFQLQDKGKLEGERSFAVQTFTDPSSPRYQLLVAQLPRGIVKFPPHIRDAIDRERVRFAPEIFTEEYARKSLEYQTLIWYYEGLPVAYKSLPDGIEVLGVGWDEAAEYWVSPRDPNVKVVQP
mgnify:CR=1 FL=1